MKLSQRQAPRRVSALLVPVYIPAFAAKIDTGYVR